MIVSKFAFYEHSILKDFIKSLSPLNNSVVLSTGYSLVIPKTPRTGHCCRAEMI